MIYVVVQLVLLVSRNRTNKIENIGQLHAVSIGNGFIYDDSLQNELELTEDNLINIR